jgi:zinc transport system permease protein
MKVVGVLLITALLIIPPAAARAFSRSPLSMALSASLIGALSVVLGMAAAAFRDTPLGPSIVLAASLQFSLIFTASRLRN